MQILKSEQLHVDSGGKEEVTQLREDLLRYTYNQSPFDSQYWDSSTKPLEYWTRLSNDSNAKQIGRIAVKVFSILPSEICDERTASRLGWFNAARRSSILPENLINCARFHGYTNGISEGDYSHTAHVALDDVPAPAGTTQNRSAPSLMDLVHEENISPSMVDKEALEEFLFNHPDPYDLGERERLKFQDPGVPAVTRSSTVFAIADYIKLDSPALAELMQPSKHASQAKSVAPSDSIQAVRPDDWSIDEFLHSTSALHCVGC
ncbi:hypothetical protein B0H13DRAFT_2372119 [Mycena leptocephala]|nr:hypothetical protein B0H13DRAFT_2372119 [Mycena leptocephala]